MENEDRQKVPTWVTENYQDPNWYGFYIHNLIPGARFLYFALNELGLVDDSITKDKLVRVVYEVFEKHGLVAGDWEMLKVCLDIIREVEFGYYQIELRKAAQDGFDDDPLI